MPLPTIPSNLQAKLDFSDLDYQFTVIKADSSKINASVLRSMGIISNESEACTQLATKFFREICPEANVKHVSILDKGRISLDVNAHPYFHAIYDIVVVKLFQLECLNTHLIHTIPTTTHDEFLNDPKLKDFVVTNCPTVLELAAKFQTLPIHEAAKDLNLDLIKKTYEQSPLTIENQNAYGNTPLHLALEKLVRLNIIQHFDSDAANAVDNAIECVKFLLEKGPNAAMKQNKGLEFPLHIAAWLNEPEIVKKIYDTNPAATIGQKKNGDTPLHIAARRCRYVRSTITMERLDPNAEKIINCLLKLDPEAAKIENYSEEIPFFTCNTTNFKAMASLIKAYPKGTGHLVSDNNSFLSELIWNFDDHIYAQTFDDQTLVQTLEIVGLILTHSPELFSPDGKRSKFPEIDSCLRMFKSKVPLSAYGRFKMKMLKKIVAMCPQSTLYRDSKNKTILMNLAERPDDHTQFIKQVAEAQVMRVQSF